MSDTSGPTSALPLMRYDLASSSWRTSAATSLWDLEMSSPTFPEWGMTHAGELYELPTPERPTVAQGSSSLRFLKTPQASNEGRVDRPERYHNRHMANTRFDLEDQIAALLPTPTVMDMGSNYTPEEWEAWKLKQKAAHNNGNGHGASLTQEALLLLPTPKATNNENQQNLNQYGPNLGMALMPEQYQWTGGNTRQQSFDGSES